jgi:hypothetical protein
MRPTRAATVDCLRPAHVLQGLDPEEEVAKARADGTLYHIDTWDEHQARYKVDAD